ncbi:hypothetical protein ACLB1R_01350 [Escherichia coli]
MQRPFRSRRLLSRRGLRSGHPGKKTPGCKAQRRFAHALHVVAAGPCSLPAWCHAPIMSPCRRGLIQPQPAALTVQGK